MLLNSAIKSIGFMLTFDISFKEPILMYKPLKRYLRQKARFYKEFRAFFIRIFDTKIKDIFCRFRLLFGIGPANKNVLL